MNNKNTSRTAALAAMAAMATTAAFAEDKPMMAILAPVNATTEGAGIFYIRSSAIEQIFRVNVRQETSGVLTPTTILGQAVFKQPDGLQLAVYTSAKVENGTTVNDFKINSINGKPVEMDRLDPALPGTTIIRGIYDQLKKGTELALKSNAEVVDVLSKKDYPPLCFQANSGIWYGGYKVGPESVRVITNGKDSATATSTSGETIIIKPDIVIPEPQKGLLEALSRRCVPRTLTP